MKSIFIIFFIALSSSVFSHIYGQCIQCCSNENNKSQIDLFFYKAYQMLRVEDQRLEWGFGDCGSDDSEPGGEPGGNDQPAMQQIDNFMINANNYYLQRYWEQSYHSIGQLNFIINAFSDSSKYTNEVAMSKFLRAYYYFNLLKNFGNVSLYLNYKEFIDFKKSRNSAEEVWNAIETDLNDASKDLPLRREIPVNDLYYISKGSAEALLVKAYIYEQKWEEAYNLGKDVISSGEYSLVGLNGERFFTKYSDATSGYQYIFDLEGENSKESIFDIQCNFLHNNLDNGTTSYITQYQNPRAYYDTCTSNHNQICTFQYGWGFNCPSDEFASEFENGDPRKSYTIAEKEDSILIWNAIKKKLEYKKINFSYSSPTHRYSKKYWLHPDYRNLTNYTSQLNIKIIRYADLILWMAEASYQLGKHNEALNYVNMVRQRARNSGSTGVPANLTSIALNDIYHERRVELGLEGHRLYDLRRTGRSAAEMSDIGFVENKHELFPIPQESIDMSEGTLTQNPGYESLRPLTIVNQPGNMSIGPGFGTSDTIYIPIENVMQDSENPSANIIYLSNDFWALNKNSYINYFIRNNNQIVLYKRSDFERTTVPLHLKGTFGSKSGYCIIIVQLLGDEPISIIKQLEDIHLNINPIPVEIDLSTLFSDEDDTLIYYSEPIVTNPDLVCVENPSLSVFKFLFTRNMEGYSDVKLTGKSNGTEANESFRFIVGNPISSIKDNNVKDILVQLYPNPAAQSITISGTFPENNIYNLSIINVIGSTVYSSKIDGKGEFSKSIGLDNFNSGVYFVKIYNKNLSSVSKLLIKK